jgi:hypothetical protein
LICANAARVAARLSAGAAGFVLVGSRLNARISAASATIASFALCSAGTKLSMVSTLETVGSRRSFAANTRASFTLGARISMLYGLLSGWFVSSRRVRIASVFWFQHPGHGGLGSDQRSPLIEEGRPRRTADADARETDQHVNHSQGFSAPGLLPQPEQNLVGDHVLNAADIDTSSSRLSGDVVMGVNYKG